MNIINLVTKLNLINKRGDNMNLNELFDPKTPEPPEDNSKIFQECDDIRVILEAFETKQFKNIIFEWVEGYLTNQYAQIKQWNNNNNNNIELVAFLNQISFKSNDWEYYHCTKLKLNKLENDFWITLCRLINYSFIKRIELPKKFYFIPSTCLSNEFKAEIEDEDYLRKNLIDNWNEFREEGFCDLNEKLEMYIQNIDFNFFEYKSPYEIKDEYYKTKWFKFRFGGGLKKTELHIEDIPDKVTNEEENSKYIQKLFCAYSTYTYPRYKKNVTNISMLEKYNELYNHFFEQRVNFYNAETLRRFARDELTKNEPFEKLQYEVLLGVKETASKDYEDGYKCVRETVEKALNLTLNFKLFQDYLSFQVRAGICHQLANHDKLGWVKNE